MSGASEAELERFFELSVDLLSISGLDGYFKRINPAFERTLGWSTDELLARPFLDFVHPDDVEATQTELARLADEIPTLSFENRYRCADGSYRRLRWTAYPDMAASLIYAIAHDITPLFEEEHRFRQALEAAPSAMLMVDDGGAITLVNLEAERLFGYARNELLGQTIELLLPSRLRDGHAAQRDGFRGQPLSRAMGSRGDLVARRKDGTEFPVEIGLNPIDDRRGAAILAAVIDLSERKAASDEIRRQAEALRAANEELLKLSRIDPLTDALNRRAFATELDSTLRMSIRIQRPVSLILIDADDFKQFNDDFGHPAGDECLQTLAGVLRATARLSDFVARIGGDEFALILPTTDGAGVQLLAQRISEALADHPWPRRPLRVSIGFATAEPPAAAAADPARAAANLISAADRALYRAKGATRAAATAPET